MNKDFRGSTRAMDFINPQEKIIQMWRRSYYKLSNHPTPGLLAYKDVYVVSTFLDILTHETGERWLKWWKRQGRCRLMLSG